ncbi:hypothetical protein TYRP_012921 [Tyrophagus putrescentiae]|nr:hypothetical protein TYRP_012921 [Tyrophagus putrescentiae]
MTTSANSSSIVSSSSTTPPSGSSKSGSMKRSPQPMSITKELEGSIPSQSSQKSLSSLALPCWTTLSGSQHC